MKIVLTYILLSICWHGMGQYRPQISGLVLNGENMVPFENVNVQNISRRTLATSNRDGHFFISADQTDTLKLTAIGFKDNVIPVISILDNQGPFVVVMQSTAYELGEITINPLGTYEQFKRKFLALKLPPENDIMTKLRLKKPVASLVPAEYDYKKVYHPMAAIFHPVTYFYKRYNKEEQAKINYYRFLVEEWPIIEIVEKKYNGGRVATLTGLEGDSLMNFMTFCNFDRNYLYRSTEYDIGVAIKEKLKEFRIKKEEMRKPEEM